MSLDPSTVLRWIEPLARAPGEIADVFVERRRAAVLLWQDGEVVQTRHVSTEGLSARSRSGGVERLASVSRAGESALREALRELQAALGRPSLPIRPGRTAPDEEEPPPSVERWRKRLASLFARHAPRHRFRWTLSESTRDVFTARGGHLSHTRRLLSVEGSFTAASRRAEETRRFCFHAPESDRATDELKARLARAAEPREAPVPCPEGSTDVVLASGSAAMLFHEILSHPLEAGAVSPLWGLAEARVAVAQLEVRDDATRLDLFGGYEGDDEGVRPRPVKLLDAGRLAARLTTRASAARMGREPSNGHGRRAESSDLPLPRGSNVVVTPGGATREEMARRLGQGLWIEDLESGSVELASGSFRLRFPRARRVRRGLLADELGPGTLYGEILPALKGVEMGLGRESHPYRSLAWCSRAGQVVAVQGEAPDLLVRGLSVRPLA
ncbi:MAG: metallopeptidase TldD-related protein [Thermoanaerobaculia bacterium]